MNSIFKNISNKIVYAFSNFSNIEGIFWKYSIEILQYCKNIYKAVRKVSKILQELAMSFENIINGILLQY